MGVDAAYAAYIKAKAAGDGEASLDDLVHHLNTQARAVAWLTLRETPPELVGDMVSTVVLQLPTFAGEARFSTWTYGIMKRLCYAKLRQRYKCREESFPELDGTLATVDDPESRIILAGVVERLNPEEQELLLAKFHQEDTDDIAQRLGLTPEGVRTRWHRLRKKLQGMLEG